MNLFDSFSWHISKFYLIFLTYWINFDLVFVFGCQVYKWTLERNKNFTSQTRRNPTHCSCTAKVFAWFTLIVFSLGSPFASYSSKGKVCECMYEHWVEEKKKKLHSIELLIYLTAFLWEGTVIWSDQRGEMSTGRLWYGSGVWTTPSWFN